MSTIIYPSPIYGPVHSRRLGISLGINLLPADGKVCTFDCIYCECGFNADHRAHQPMPTREEVAEALERQLKKMQAEGALPDVITFAGNGEPTINPAFPQIIDDTIRLRNQYCPESKVSVLSNATQTGRPEVREALLKVDNNILKLDTVSPDYIAAVDRPTGHYNVSDIIENLKRFDHRLIIQTIFFHSPTLSNTGDDYVLPWLDAVESIDPRQVMIYTIDRETPDRTLTKATPDELNRIGTLVEERGISCSVSY